jgi:hypothetical protein
MLNAILYAFAAIFLAASAGCDGCSPSPDPKAQKAIEAAREWVVANGYSLDGLTFRATSNLDRGEWTVLMETSGGPAGGHTALLLNEEFVVETVWLGR